MDQISFDDFQKVDIRIGRVIEAVVPEWSHWVIKLVVDFGDPPDGGGKKNIFTGMLNFYKPENFKNRQFPFVINLKPKKIGPEGDFSEGMLLATSIPSKSGKPEDEKPVLFKLTKKVPNGTKVR